MRFFVTCARGTEGPLRRELADLRIRGPRGAEGGVAFDGRFEEGLLACLWSRVGMRVLLELGAFAAPSADALYEGARALPWSDHLDARATLAVSATVRDNPAFTHTGFAALKVKDAVVDHLRERLGARPNVSPDDPDVPIVLHVRGTEAHLYLDLAGEPLHRRGYRVAMTDAPLKENLAAAVLALCDATTAEAFLDPMAGSGTFAIEQALRARRIAPGRDRRFAFERWPDPAHARAFAALRETARAGELAEAPAPIVARDMDPAAIAALRRNATAAGVDGDITCAVGPLAGLRPAAARGTVVVNPPYGERLGAPSPRGRGAPLGGGSTDRRDGDALARVYGEIGALLETFPGWTLAVLSGNPLFTRVVRRKPDISHKLFNGPLETRLLVYRAAADSP